MLCVPVTGPDLTAAEHQVKEALLQAHILEFRLDFFIENDLQKLKELRDTIPLPLIFTLRKKEQGGFYQGSEKERLQQLRRLAALAPTYLDLEDDVDPLFIQQLSKDFPTLQLIISHHNFTHTPVDLDALLQRMRKLPGHLYKIACTATSTNDALRMLDFVRQHAPLLGICMGEKGVLTRILGPMMGAPWTFASLHQQTAEGQLSIEELQAIYNFSDLHKTTAIYGLIGGIVATSLSHFSHNKAMKELSLNAVYVKMSVEANELGDFFTLAKKIGIQGLSVTMPLKEEVLCFLDDIDLEAKKIGAVNTIVIRQGKLKGYNTDGKGALNALEQHTPLLNKNLLLLGAGGAARALIYEALKRGAKLRVLNRTPEKAALLAEEFGIQGGALTSVNDHSYDILMNTTPDPLPIPSTAIRAHSLVMDIKSRPKMTALLQHASEKGCALVFGYEMFINQAVEQFQLWFSSDLDLSRVQALLQQEVLKQLS